MKTVIASLLFAGLATGCVVRGSGYVTTPDYVEVQSSPPPPRYAVYEERPGYIYIDGRWNWNGGQWVWQEGRYENQRVGYGYSQGYWDTRGSGHVWVEGRWESGGNGGYRNGNRGRWEGRGNGNANGNGGVEVRDHRSNPPPQQQEQPQGPVVRDHRR